jgi:hypothetical protein
MEIKRIIAIGMMACVGIAVWRMGAMQEVNIDNSQSDGYCFLKWQFVVIN